jgi:hypothetical protein
LDTSYDTDATDSTATTDLDSSRYFSSCFSSPVLPAAAATATRSAGSGLETSHDRELLRQRMAAVHKPARGRQRAKQLNEMTEEEREVERELIMEKNRLAARDCRVRKKSFIHTLQDKIKSQDVLHEEQEAQILALQAENAQIKAELQRVLASMNTTPPPSPTPSPNTTTRPPTLPPSLAFVSFSGFSR